MPGLALKSFDIANDQLLKQWLALSEKVRSFYADPSRKEQPSRDPSAYAGYSWTGSRLNRKGVVLGLYSRAKKGDLVLLTSPGQAWGITRIGEFTDTPADVFYDHHPRYANENLPARRVRWVGAIENRFLPQEVVRQLTSPNAFSLLGRSYHDQIFAAAYENYFRSTDESNSLFDIKSERFSTVPDMYLKVIANFAGEVAKHVDAGAGLDDFLRLSFDDWFGNIADGEYFADQKIRINSPGQNVLQCAKMTPILAALLFALLQFPPATLHGAELAFENTAAGGQLDECDIPVADAAQLVFKTMSLEKLEKMCRIAKQARELGKIETPIRTTDTLTPSSSPTKPQ
jgi:hypothetical protein